MKKKQNKIDLILDISLTERMFYGRERYLKHAKQALYKEIMECLPEESHINYYIDDGVEYREQADIGLSIQWEKGFNSALSEIRKSIDELFGKGVK